MFRKRHDLFYAVFYRMWHTSLVNDRNYFWHLWQGQLHIKYLQGKILLIFIIIFNIISKYVSKSFHMNYEVLLFLKLFSALMTRVFLHIISSRHNSELKLFFPIEIKKIFHLKFSLKIYLLLYLYDIENDDKAQKNFILKVYYMKLLLSLVQKRI